MNNNLPFPENHAPFSDPGKRVCPRCGNPIQARFCSLCGYDSAQADFLSGAAPMPDPALTPGYTVLAPKKSKLPYLILAAIAALLVAAFIITLACVRTFGNPFSKDADPSPKIPADSERYYLPNGVSLSEYYQLKKGMTYARVSKIIGGDGVLIENGQSVDGTPYYVYGWPGEDNPYAELYVTISNDVVIEITTQNLLPE